MLLVELEHKLVRERLLCVPGVRDGLMRLSGRADDPAEPLGHAADGGKDERRAAGCDEVVRQARVDDADHARGEPDRVEGGEEAVSWLSAWSSGVNAGKRSQLVVYVLHRVAHLGGNLCRADDGSAHAGCVVPICTTRKKNIVSGLPEGSQN